MPYLELELWHCKLILHLWPQHPILMLLHVLLALHLTQLPANSPANQQRMALHSHGRLEETSGSQLQPAQLWLW